MRFLRYVILLMLFASASATAGYDANISGIVTKVLTYTGGPHIFVRLNNQPASHPACLTDFFAVDGTLSDSVRAQVLARLLVAYSTGEVVNIGYDSVGDCANGRIRIHRVG